MFPATHSHGRARAREIINECIFFDLKSSSSLVNHKFYFIFVLSHKAKFMIYPIGIQNFEKLRNDGYVYVDKTAHIHRLATTGSYYFLRRPRRFGKSLLISTMHAYFSGKRELFKGLALERLEQKWTKHPILHLDLNTGKYDSEEELNDVLNQHLRSWEKLYGTNQSETSLHLRFLGIVQRACEKTGERVVILVDEYDKPMLQAIGNDELQTRFRNTLKAFYSVLKTQDQYIKFGFLTGVTKFGKVSVFSDLNNLQDISMDEEYADICGITEKEIHACFEESVNELATACKLSYEETCTKLKEQYDGYHFEYDTEGVYNPFSLLNTFNKCKFRDYWFETGTPSFLVELLKRTDYRLDRLQEEEITGDVINSIDSMSQNPIPVIYQSGYLTVKGYDEEFKLYRLGFPNMEVKQGFINYLVPFYTPISENSTAFFIKNFIKDVEQGRPEQFMERLHAMFADSSYELVGDMEKYFQNAMYLIFMMMGFYTEVERRTSRGRMDICIRTKDYVYIMELKLDGSAEAALQQIDEKGYAAPFAADSRQLYKIGVNFSTASRGIDSYLIQ